MKILMEVRIATEVTSALKAGTGISLATRILVQAARQNKEKWRRQIPKQGKVEEADTQANRLVAFAQSLSDKDAARFDSLAGSSAGAGSGVRTPPAERRGVEDMFIKHAARLVIAACVISACLAGAAGAAANCLQADTSASTGAASQDEVATPEAVTTPAPRSSAEVPIIPGEMVAGGRYLSSREFLLALLVTAILFISLSFQFALLRKIERLKAEDTLRSFGLTLVITGTVFFIVAGFDTEQIAPAIGLFGTIAGYILGRSERRGNGRNE